MDTVNIYNTSEVEQTAFTDDGKRHQLGPYEIRLMPEDIAKAFLSQRGRYVQPYVAVQLPRVAGEDIVWIANATGNPFDPDKIKLKKFDPKTNIEEMYEVENPRKKARPLTREMQSEQKVVRSKHGTFFESLSFPPTKIKIPPFTRHPASRSIAEWLVRRDYQQDDLHKGSLVICRQPSGFEPNDSWSVDEIYTYAEIVDDQTKWRKRFVAIDKDHESRVRLLNALFFRLIDERYALPPRDYFEIVMKDRKREDRQETKNASAADSRAAASV